MPFITEGKTNLKYILIVVVLAVVVGILILTYQWGIPKEEVKMPAAEEEEVETIIEEEDGILEMILGSPDAQVAPLTAVDGSNSSGAAYRLFKDGKLYHAVMATMPEPQEGNVYEGWLVQPSPLQFLSTGVMKKNEGGIWTLEYTSDNEYPSYTKVVITEETVVDAIPETHIIEGSFF